MILLEIGNRILAETVQDALTPPEHDEEKKKGKRPPVSLCDFDQVSYQVQNDGDHVSILMSLPTFDEIKDKGALDAMNTFYGPAVCEATDGFSVALKYNIAETKNKQEVVDKVKIFKSVVTGGVFKYFYSNLAAGTKVEHFKFDLRSDTSIYFVPDDKGERTTTIYALDFNERVDKVVAKVFMQEFVDARRTLGFAPPVSWSAQPPAELQKWGITENKGGTLGYISFSILKTHVTSPQKIDQIVAVLQNFRSYIQYHIKCSKSYFHSRMRVRVVNLLKVLNRARVEDPEKDKSKGKKTISGKTFRRAAGPPTPVKK